MFDLITFATLPRKTQNMNVISKIKGIICSPTLGLNYTACGKQCDRVFSRKGTRGLKHYG